MHSEDVSFNSSIDGVTLNGTFVNVEGSKKVVLMIGGSGPTDRDETAQPNETFSGKKEKLFLQIANALAQAGVSSFRYDKRGVLNEKGEKNKEMWIKTDREHLISDAADAANYAISKSSLSPKDLIILGHSEGTSIGVEVAILLGEVKGILMLGAQARSMKEMLHYQIVESQDASRSGEDNTPEEDYEKALKMIQDTEGDWAPDGKPINWYRQFLAAPSNAKRLTLVNGFKAAFQGEEDYSTPIDEIEIFKKHGNEDLAVFTYPKLGHCFSPNKDGKPTFGPIDDKVLADIINTATEW